MLAPAGTPKPIAERLNKEMKAALEDATVSADSSKAGAEVMCLPLDQSKAFLHGEVAKYRDIITKAGIPQIE